MISCVDARIDDNQASNIPNSLGEKVSQQSVFQLFPCITLRQLADSEIGIK